MLNYTAIILGAGPHSDANIPCSHISYTILIWFTIPIGQYLLWDRMGDCPSVGEIYTRRPASYKLPALFGGRHGGWPEIELAGDKLPRGPKVGTRPTVGIVSRHLKFMRAARGDIQDNYFWASPEINFTPSRGMLATVQSSLILDRKSAAG